MENHAINLLTWSSQVFKQILYAHNWDFLDRKKDINSD